MKILAASDIHLGRLPTHGSSTDLPWHAVVDKAIELAVDVLVLAGDIIEHDTRWIGSSGEIDAAVEKLRKAEIKVFAVGGNHDWDVLPYLASFTEEITILGQGGLWEAVEYNGVHFVGWSFPKAHIPYNPLGSFDTSLIADAKLSLGLLHADVDATSSSYAPVSRASLQAAPVDLWVLGHLHAPRYMADAKSCYCGSPYAFDPGERGDHGAYLIEQSSKQAWKEPVFIPLSPIRYEEIQISVTERKTVEEIRTLVRTQAQEALQQSPAEALYVEVVFTGALDTGIELSDVITLDETEESIAVYDGKTCYLRSKYRDESTVAIDLEALAKGSGADALLAKKISDETELLRLYRQLSHESYSSSAYRSLPKTEESEKEELALAKEAAMQLLRAMVKQRKERQV